MNNHKDTKAQRHMMKRTLLLMSAAALFVAATLVAQGPQGPANREVPAPNVSFDRILKSNQEPQNWLT